VYVLTAAVDVQKDHFLWSVKGWGFDFSSIHLGHGRSNTLDGLLAKMVGGVWGGKKVSALAIDAGFETDKVYALAAAYPGFVYAIKGAEEIASGLPYSTTRIRRDHLKGKTLDGGGILWRLNTTHYKNWLFRLILDRKWIIPDGIDHDYLAQVTAEKKVFEVVRRTGKGKWVWRLKGPALPNHYLDTEVYNLAIADILEVGSLRSVIEQQDEAQAPPAQPGRGQSKWMSRVRRR
jgi:phage terminase large subunit GpA-like protein